MAPPKGKAPTKGAKQIVTENLATVKFYRNMAFGSFSLYGVLMVSLYAESFTFWLIALNICLLIVYIGCYQLMLYMSCPTYSDTNQVIDPGVDLNMEGGLGEHIKDVIILLSITQVLAIISNWFWLLLLLVPMRAFWIIWVNFLGPWFFQEAPQDTEQDEKKRKKMERKMKRYQQ